jgi:biotin synthase
MVGSPYQTTENLIADLRFLQKLQPDMIGIGPYISHQDTPFRNEKNGTAEITITVTNQHGEVVLSNVTEAVVKRKMV